MTELQIYAGLAPVMLGVVALVMSQIELRSVRHRKAGRNPASVAMANGRVENVAIVGFNSMKRVGVAVSGCLLIAAVWVFVAQIIVPFAQQAGVGKSVAINTKEAIGADIVDAQNRKIGEVTDFQITSRGGNAKVIVGNTRPGQAASPIVMPVDSLVWQRIEGDTANSDEAYKAVAKNGLDYKRSIN